MKGESEGESAEPDQGAKLVEPGQTIRKTSSHRPFDVLGATGGAGENAAVAVALIGGVLEVRPGGMGAGPVPKVDDGVERLAPPPSGGEQDDEQQELRMTPMVHEGLRQSRVTIAGVQTV